MTKEEKLVKVVGTFLEAWNMNQEAFSFKIELDSLDEKYERKRVDLQSQRVMEEKRILSQMTDAVNSLNAKVKELNAQLQEVQLIGVALSHGHRGGR